MNRYLRFVAPLLALVVAAQTTAAIRTFAPRYNVNAKGDITFVSNVNLTCPAGGTCPTAQQTAYNTGGSTNNNYSMINVDIDAVATTFNSSSATLSVPSGSTIAFAGLYWAGQTTNVARNAVLLATPTNATYQTVTATQLDDVGGLSYQGFTDVTAIVAAAGTGVYTVANVRSDLGTNQYAGWTLVVVYNNSSLPTRNLVVYDGYQRVAQSTPPINISLSGFITPPFGPVNSKLGIIGYDGDRGSTEGTAGLLFGPSATSLNPVFDASNPQTDVFNSSISTLGVLNTGRSPAYQNTLGYDADIFAPNTPLPNNATTAAIRVQSSSETIDVGVITLATDIFVPNIKDTLTKTVAKVAGSAGATVLPGDTLEYTLNFFNSGQDGALNVRLADTLPAKTTYVPNSIVVTNTPVTGPAVISNSGSGATDAFGDDIAEYDASTRRVNVRAGAGATATQGGTLIPANASNLPSTQVKFRVTVDAATQGGTVIDNFGSVSSVQQTLGGTITDISDSNPTQAGDQPARVVVATPDLTITKTAVGSFVQGQSASYTLTVTNAGTAPGFGTVSVVDSLPTGLTITAISGPGWNCVVATATCTRSDVLATATSYPAITVTVTVASDAPANVSNIASVNCNCEAATATGNNTATTPTPIVSAPVLATTKVAGAPFIRGSTSSYTLTASTTGAGSGTNGSAVTITDNLPGGITLDGPPTGAPNWTCTGAAGASSFSCTTNALIAANGNFSPVNVPIRVGLNAPAEVINTITLAGGGAITPTSATAITPVTASTDRSVSKSVRNITTPANSASPNVSDVVEFTLVATNGGPSIATNVVVTDLLNAAQFSFTSANATQGGYVSGTGVWSVGSLQPGASATLRIRAVVLAAGTLINAASIAGTEPDPVSTNDTTSISLQGQSADLSLTKTVDSATPNVGGTIVFTLTVANAGPSAATGIVVTDLLPANLSFLSTNSPNYDAATGKWAVGDLLTGGSTSITITAKPLVAGPIVNKAEITKSDQFDPDSTPGNGVASEDDQAQVTIVASQADLSIAKAVDNPNPLLGETIVYTVTVANAGPSSATGVVVSENIPSGLSVISAIPSQGAFTAPTWTVGTIANGGRAVLTIVAVYVGPGRVTNTASITASDQPDPTPNPPVSVTVPSQIADLSLTKSVDNAFPNLGTNVVYTITVNNAGPDTATGIVVGDPIPTGLAVVTATPSQGSFDAVGGEWTAGSLASGGSATLQITAKVTGLAAITNTAEIKSTRQYDPNSTPNNNVASENDQASVTITPQSADLRLSKSVTPSNPTAASPTVTYTIRISNNGPSAANNVTVDDVLPAGIALNAASVNASIGTLDTSTGVWTILTLANGASATLTFTANVTVFGQALTNAARISGSDKPDPTPEGAATATVLGQVADLLLTKTANTATPDVNGNVVFTLTATNNGPDAASGVVVRDLLPSGLTFVSATATIGAYDSVTGLWNIGAIAFPGNAVLTLTARVSQITATPIVNRAEVAASDQFDPNSKPNNVPSDENDEAETTVTPVPQADVIIAKASPATLNPGAPATYALIVTNLGPSSAQNVQITDPTPAGLTQIGVSGAGCSSLPCGLGALAPGETRRVEVIYNVNFPAPSASIINTASVSTTTADPSSGNNTATATTPVVRDADIRVTKTGSVSAVPGEFVDYEITVTNDGPATAASVQLVDPTLAGYTFVGASAPCASGVSNCTLGDLTVGATVTISVRYRVGANAPSGSLTNIATATSTGANASPDLNTTNNIGSAQTIIDAPRANVGITKVGPATVLRGDSITYTLVVSNAGPSNATGVVVTDPTPAGLTLTSVSGDCTSLASGACSFATLPVGVTRTIQATYTVPLTYVGPTSANDIENRASLTTTSSDSDLSDNVGIANTTAITPPPILNVRKTSSASFTRGSVGSYSITVSTAAAAGPTTGAVVTVSDTLPNGITLSGVASGSGWTCTSAGASSFSCTNTSVIAAGGSYPSINVPVLVGLSADPSVTNTASTEGGGATNPATGQVTTPVTSSADLTLSKGVDRNAPTAANPFAVFTLIAENAGPSTAAAVTVQDSLPAGMTFISATPSLGSYNSGTGAWTLGDLLPGTRATLAIRVQVTDFTNTITNNASIASVGTPDPLPDNNIASATLRGQVANLSLEKAASKTTPNVQSEIDFILTVRNAGPDGATGVEVSDPLPAGLAFVSASSPNYNASTGVWTVGSVAANAQSTLTIRVRVTAPDAIINRAQIAASDQFDPDSTPGNSNASENDDASVTIFPQQSDVRLAKRVDKPNPLRGDAITYVVELTNLGPSPATNVSVIESLPAGIDFNSFVPSVGVFDPGSGVWGVASIAPNARATLTLSGIFRGPSAQTNTATIAALDQYDPTPNTPVSITIPSQIADLSLTKSVDNSNPVQGSNVQFTITLSNAGPNTATSVVVNDLLPPGLSFASANPATGAYDSASGNWNVGSLAASANTTITITAKVDSFVAITNTARVANAAQYDPDSVPNNDDASEDDQQSVVITPRSADLRLSKRVSTNAPTVANPNVAFTVEVFNAGPDTATNVQVRDALPAGVNLLSSTPAAPDFAASVWTIPSLAAGARATLTINAAVIDFTRPITNTAQIIGSSLPDPTPNEQASATLRGQVADLSLTKTVDTAAPRVGGVVRYTVTVNNAGPDAATNVSVLDRLPAGLALSDVIASSGSYDASSGVWSVGTVAANVPATLTLLARVTQLTATPINNTAEIRSSDQFDPNSTPNNAQASENDQATATITPVPLADISVAKLPPAQLNPGTNATYTIVVKNQGPSVAASVVLADPGPAGLAFVSATCGAFFPCALGNLQAGEERVITATYRVPFPFTLPDPVTNVATATSSTLDPDLRNNTDAVGAAVNASADLQLVKAGPANVVAGANATYTITVTNAGPSSAGDVIIDDPLQPGIVAVVSVSGSGCSTLPCNVGTLGPSQSASISVTLRIDPAAANSATIRNVATVSSNTPDANIANNAGSASAIVSGQIADLRVRKTGPATARPGEIISFAIEIQNLGPSNATDVNVVDPTPANFTVTSVTGACTALPCNIATVNVGATIALTVTGTVGTAITNGGAINNTVNVTAATGDPSTNESTAVVSILTIADLTPTISALPPIVVGVPVRVNVTVTNIGGAPTVGVQRVVITLPVDASASLFGAPAGYVCTAVSGTLTCESNTALAPGQSVVLPIDIVFVSTGSGAVLSVEVSGGGELRIDNNRASTAGTTVVAKVIPTLSMGVLAFMTLALMCIAVGQGRRRRAVARAL
jgi:large repetitive protein